MSIMPRVASIALLAVAGVALLAVLARAQAPQQPPPPPNVEAIRDVVFGKGGARDLHMDIARPKRQPAEPMPVVVYIHGGAWLGGDHHGPQNYPLAASGFFTANIEYRLSREAVWPAQIEDCKAAVRYLRAHAEEYHINRDRIGVWGHSAGGHLAAMMGASVGVKELEGTGGNPEQSSAVQAVIDGFGPSDLSKIADFPSGIDRSRADCPEALLIGGALKDNPDRAASASPVTYVDGNEPPFLILHGEQDDTVPFNQSELMAAALQKVKGDVSFIRVRNAGHGFGPQSDPSPKVINFIVIGFFARYLR